MRRIPNIFIGIFFTLLLTKGYAQVSRYEFERITIDQGLSQSTVYCILQDYLGYMWFGTEDGLNRYDGITFKVYSNQPQNDSTLSNNRVMVLFEDSKHNLWIGTLGGGLNRYNRIEDSFEVYKHSEKTGSISSDVVMSICEDKNGRLWVGTAGGGVNVFDTATEQFTNFGSKPSSLVRSLLCTSDGEILLGTDKGLFVFNDEKNDFIHLADIFSGNDADYRKIVVSITEDSCGYIWICVDDSGIIRFSFKDKSITHFTTSKSSLIVLTSNSILEVIEDEYNDFWFATYNGLQKYTPNSQKVSTFFYKQSDPVSISSNILRSLYEDKSGVLWIGTYRDGINKINRKVPKFNVYRNNTFVPGSLPSSSIRSIFEGEDSNLFIATYGHGVVLLNTENDLVNLNPLGLNSESTDLNRNVTSITADKSKNIWFGYDGSGLKMVNPKSNKVAIYRHNPDQKSSIPTNRIRCLYIDKQDELWIGALGEGLIHFDKKNGSFTAYKPQDDNLEETISQDRILCIFEDSHNNFWVGTSSEGLNLFNRNNGKSVHFKHSEGDSATLSSDRILCITEDSQGLLWVGTGVGLNLFDHENKSFKHFGKPNGLPNDVIYGILEDESGNLWLSTNNGLSRIKVENDSLVSIRNYSKSDGLQSNEFTEGAFLKLKSGSLVFGGIGGLNIFNPSSIIENQVPPAVHIERITLFNNQRNNQERVTQEINATNTESLILPHNQNNITFQFIGLHFVNPQNIKYLYKLEGFDPDWLSPVEGQRFASYTNLEHGKYTFRVIAANSDGVWNDSGDSISITINPPFWKTWWFWTLVAASIIGLFIIILRYREASLRKMKKILEERVRMRTHEILQQKEEIESQRDYLSKLNTELQQKNEEITAQHEELEKAQKQLVQSEKMASIGLLTAGIAHEINNPINFVYAGVNSITHDFEDVERVLRELKNIENNSADPAETIKRIKLLKEEHGFEDAYSAIIQTIEDIKIGAERTAEIVEGLRNFSRTESEEWTLGNLHKITDSILILLKNKYKNNIEIVKDFDDNLPEIECKRGKINQVVMNLLSNAIDSIEGKGKIAITTKLEGDNCILSLKDTGKGMTEDVMQKIFDPFFTTKAVGKGVGLGLSITYGIVQEHKGYIDVKSSPGKGTEFILTLPVKQN